MPDPRAFDPQVRAALLGLLRKGQRRRLGHRLLAGGLTCACAYLALLLALLLFGLPLLWFHLLFYVCLALLPLFLVLEAGESRTRFVLRGLDDRCQLESYLSAASAEHRAFLKPRVLALLDRRTAERPPPFRLHRWNLRLAAAAAGLLLLFLAAGWLTFGSVRPALSPAALASRQARAEAVDFGKTQRARPAGRTAGPAEGAEAVEPAKEAGTAGTGRREQGEAPPGRGGGGVEGVAVDQSPDSPGSEPPPAEPEAGSGAAPLLRAPGGPGEPGEPGAAFGEATGEARRQPLLPGGSEAGTGDTGRSLLESPLREYGTRADRIPTEGGQSLAANQGTAVPLEPDRRPASFSDFPLSIPSAAGFDPAMRRIGRRYLELLDARY